MAPVLSIDIDSVITSLSKADGDSLSAAEMGLSALSNAVAGTLPNGDRCIASNGSAALTFRPEALATAAARTEDHYAMRFKLRPVASGAITPANTADFVRHAGTSDPRFHISVNADYVGFASRHASPGVPNQFMQAQTGTVGRGVPYGSSVDVVWIAHRSGTAASDFVGLFIDGVCVGAGTNLQNAVTFSNAVMLSLPNTANLTWQIHGTIEVYSVDDYQAEGFLKSPDAGYQIAMACGGATGFRPPGVSWTNSGFTLADEAQNVGSGINIGDHAIALTGSIGSSHTLTWVPPVTPTFSSRGYCHWEFGQVEAAVASSAICRIRDGSGNNIVSVRIRDDPIDGTLLEYKVGAAAYVTLEDTDLILDHLHVIRITQRSDGRCFIVVKDDTIDSTNDGQVWSVAVDTGVTTPAADLQQVYTANNGSPVTLRRGHLQFYHTAVADVYTDSWSSGDPASEAPTPQNQIPNHIPAQLRGSRVGERFSPSTLSPMLPTTPPIPVWGNAVFGRRGWSVEDWVSVSPDMPDHIAGSLCLVGLSCMNSMVEQKAAIDAGGAGAAAALATTAGHYIDAVERLLANGNDVWFCGMIPPPVSAPNSITAAQQQWVRDVNAAIVAALLSLSVPSGSRLIVSDVLTHAEGLGEDPPSEWGWDSFSIHLTSTYDARYAEYAIASAVEVVGGRTVRRAPVLNSNSTTFTTSLIHGDATADRWWW